MPEDWNRVRLGDYTTVKARLGWKGLLAHEYLDDGFIFLATPNLKGHQIDFDNVNYISKWRFNESPEIQLRKHDVLIVKDGSTLGTSNFVRHLPRPATVNGSIAVVRVNGSLHPEFLYHFVNGEEFQKLIAEKKSGLGVPHLFQADLREFPVSLPPLEEQRCIAEILSKLDRAIEQTEALITKQQRIKTGLMQDLLTRGIDEQGDLRSEETHQFKDSPLGRIPVEWEPSTLGKLATFYSGYAFKNQELTEHGWRVVRISNLHKPNFPFWYYDGPIKQSWVIRSGNILFSWAGVASSIDCVRYVGPDALMNQHIYNLKFASEEIRSYVYYFLQGYLPVLRTEIEGGAGQLHLTKAKIQSIPIPELATDELNRTIELLDMVESRINGQERQLRKLHLLKTALMQDLLTGEKRVTPLLEPAVTT